VPERSAALDVLARDLLTFAGYFERYAARSVATGGLGKKTLGRLAAGLRRSDEEYAAFLGIFLIDRRILFEGDERWEVSRQNLLRSWQPERLLRSFLHFWMRTPLWNESLQDPDVLSFVRREYVSQDPSLEARRRRLCEELLSTAPGVAIDVAALIARLDRSFQGRSRSARTAPPAAASPGERGGAAFAPYGGRLSPAASVRRMLGGPLSWLGIVELDVSSRRAPATAEVEAFRVTPLGREALAEDWDAIARRLAPPLFDAGARITVQPNLEVLAPPDLDPEVYLNLARLTDLRSVDIYTSLAITWESMMNALDRGSSQEELLAFLESVSTNEIPATVRQLIADCAGRHGEVRIGVAGPYVEARESRLLRELEANPRFAPFIQRRIGEHLALLTSNVDLNRLRKELRKAGYSVFSGGPEKVQATAHGAQLSLSRREVEELYAAVRAGILLARELDPEYDLSALATIEETLALELTRQEDSGAERARELEALAERVLRARTKEKPAAAPSAEVREMEEIRDLLTAAVESHRPMEIEYDGFQGVTRRVIEPASFDGRYLTAYCRLRQDQRVFNTAKILSAKLIAE
jgi:hypothetical protein